MTSLNELFLSAPGKAILFGEHSVVYGRTAVAGSIDLRTYLSLYTSNDGRIYLCLPDIGVEKNWMLKDFLQIAEELDDIDINDDTAPSLEILVPLARKIVGCGGGSADDSASGVQNLAVLAFLFVLLGVTQRRRNLLAVKVTLRFKLPSCVGLGSSGAYCVCIAAALLCTAGIIPRPNAQTSCADTFTWSENYLEVIRRWSASAESLIHGRASGLDAAVCTYGGISSYKIGNPIQRLSNCPDLKIILINSKVERSTIRMVTTVKEKLKRFPAVIDGIFNSMDAISFEAIKILDKSSGSVCTDSANSSSTDDERRSIASNEISSSADDYARLNELSRINNHLLIALGVGHPKVDQICTILARYGIYPKMTGAGGGGSVFAFLKPDISQTLLDMIQGEITALGFEMWQPTLGSDGVVMHAKKFDINVIADKS